MSNWRYQGRWRVFGQWVLMSVGLCLFASCDRYRSRQMEKKAIALIRAYEREIAPLDKGVAVAEYEAAQGSSPYAFGCLGDLREERALALSAPARFKTVARWHREKTFEDAYLSRQIGRIYYNTLLCQTDTATLKRMARLETYLYEQVIRYLGRTPRDTVPADTLSADTLSLAEAPLPISALLRDSIVALVQCRNAVVRKAGFNDFYDYQLARMDMAPDSLDVWFHTFDTMTRGAYQYLKGEIDDELAARYGIPVSDLRAWHYKATFFQDIFNLYDIGQARSYENKNVANLAVGFFESVGLYIRDIFLRSDLRPRPGKVSYVRCYDLDHRGDVRLLCGLGADMESMCDALWVGGVALYRKNVSETLPYLLRDMDYSVLCEATGRLFWRLPFNETWLQGMGIRYMPSDLRRTRLESYMNLHAQQLVFCRWGLVMYHFERALYRNPEQDLDKLWQELQMEYQLLSSADDVGAGGDDWATKWHIILRPCYYHNYLLGSAVACQLNAYVCDSVLRTPDYWTPDYMATEEVGRFFENKIFWCGDAYPWREVLERATGRPFSLDYYAKWLVGSEPYAEWRAEEDAVDQARRDKYLNRK